MLNKNVKRTCILLAVFVILLISIKPVVKILYPIKYERLIITYSKEYNVNPNLVAAVIKRESKFNPKAISSKGAMGLMQIMPKTGLWIAEELKIDNFNEDMLYDEEINIKMGCWYLNYLSKEFQGNFQLIVAAYNGGPGNVKKWLNDYRYSQDGRNLTNIPFKETKKYLKIITRNYKIYTNLYEL